jgi:hypothetical protein
MTSPRQATLSSPRLGSSNSESKPHRHSKETRASKRVVDESILGEGPLPDGWFMKIHSSGRPFFLNSHTRKTTWVDPRLNLGKDESLPDGWEIAIDKRGGLYYIDHVNKRTQREHPGTAIRVITQGSDFLDVTSTIDSGSGSEDKTAFTRRSSQGSLVSWGSLQSLISSVSELSQGLSSVSSGAFQTAKALLVGGEAKPSATRIAHTFSISESEADSITPVYEKRV